MRTKSYILVTGGCGYIGSHMALALKEAGYIPVILDNLSTGQRQAALDAIFIEGDIADRNLLMHLFNEYPIAAVMHFAAYIDVAESMRYPDKYYKNNVAASSAFFESMCSAHINKIIYSSTAAVYGEPEYTPIDEAHPLHPVNPYGESKLMTETMLQNYARVFDWQYSIFRYFNAAGAHPNAMLGECHQPETHLIPRAIQAALSGEEMQVYGDDYATADGTCIRDFVHVEDLCAAHLQALEYLLQGGKNEVYNLGTSHGFSVREVLAAVTQITGKKINVRVMPRRLGDPAILVADASKAKKILGWQATHRDLHTMINHTYAFIVKSLFGVTA